MKLPSLLAVGAMIVGLMAAPVPVAAQSFSFSIGIDGPRYYHRDRYPRVHRFRSYRPIYRVPRHRVRLPRARVHVDLGPFRIVARGTPAHIQRCKARFRSYHIASDTYLGFDGKRHRCRY